MMNRLFLALIVPFLASVYSLNADVCGKVDAGPTYIHIDVLQSGKTVKRIDMGGVKADSSIVVWKGLCVKPTFLYGNGHGEIISAGGSVGHYSPFWEKFSLTPAIGCVYTQLGTTIPVSLPEEVLRLLPPIPRGHAKERFYSVSPYLALDFTWTFTPGWRIVAVYQYSWSRTLTTIGLNKAFKPVESLVGPVDNYKEWSHSQGSNYGLMLEGDINQCWSVSIGGAYNLGLSKEKHGLRAYGARIAIAYWF